VTDRQTDGQTDDHTISITCFSIADARKNCLIILFNTVTFKLFHEIVPGLNEKQKPMFVGTRSK